jgi:hypothetical protein
MIDDNYRRKLVNEWERLPSGAECKINKVLRSLPADYRQTKIEEYDERLGIIAEGREPDDDDIVFAWSSTLHRDFK